MVISGGGGGRRPIQGWKWEAQTTGPQGCIATQEKEEGFIRTVNGKVAFKSYIEILRSGFDRFKNK